MSMLRLLSQRRLYVCQQCIRRQHTLAPDATAWAALRKDRKARQATWDERAGRIKAGAEKSMLSVLEERGYVKDVAGGREALDWLLTEKPIGAYVGVDPTAPSLHVGHLLPLMVLYWMFIHGYYTVSLLGGGTVVIGDPSGRMTARSRGKSSLQRMNTGAMQEQLSRLWSNVKALGIKHQYPPEIDRRRSLLNNKGWLEKLTAVELMRDIGSGMRLGSMLARDSVKVRMESGEGMAISEFSYPLFQAYDWWHMYKEHGVQLQIGGSDQYGNICAGMDAVGHMRWLDVAGALGTKKRTNEPREDESRKGTFGITTPLLTTASGEKFGKSAGNAVWLDQEMMSSFDLYQYFLKTADNDVERYLKLFTFLPLEQINLLMGQQRNDESRRVAQHVLAKEIVELAHGANAAKQAEAAHAEAFSLGTNTFSLSALRKSMARIKASTADTPSKAPAVTNKSSKKHAENAQALSEYKRSFAAPLTAQAQSGTAHEQSKSESQDMVTLPLSLLQPGSFPRVLHAAGLASSRSDANRLIASKGAYVVVPNSGSTDVPTALQWINIEASATANPSHFLVDWDALVLRSGKSKIKICRILTDDQFETEGLTCPGWEEIQKKRDEAKRSGQVEKSEGV